MSKKRKRDYVPALSSRNLRIALRAIDRLPVNKRSKKVLQDMLLEAASPDESDTRHPGKHGRQIRATAQRLMLRDLQHIARVNAAVNATDLDDEAWLDRIEQLFADELDEEA